MCPVQVSHTEPDHSFLVPAVLDLYPEATVVASKVALNFLSGLTNRWVLTLFFIWVVTLVFCPPRVLETRPFQTGGFLRVLETTSWLLLLLLYVCCCCCRAQGVQAAGSQGRRQSGSGWRSCHGVCDGSKPALA